MLTVTLNIRALRAVLTAVSTAETRYYLNGINLEFTPDGVIMAATDGHRMIVLRQPYGTERPTAAHRSVIVPRDLIAKLKVKHRVIEETTLTIEDDGRLTFEHGGDVIGGRAIDATGPTRPGNLTRLMTEASLVLNRMELVRTDPRGEIFSDEAFGDDDADVEAAGAAPPP